MVLFLEKYILFWQVLCTKCSHLQGKGANFSCQFLYRFFEFDTSNMAYIRLLGGVAVVGGGYFAFSFFMNGRVSKREFTCHNAPCSLQPKLGGRSDHPGLS